MFQGSLTPKPSEWVLPCRAEEDGFGGFPSRVHRQASVRLDGKHLYCGPWGKLAADEKARKVIAAYLPTGKMPTVIAPAGSATGMSVAELILAYTARVAIDYVEEGQPTKEVSVIRDTLKVLRELYGALSSRDVLIAAKRMAAATALAVKIERYARRPWPAAYRPTSP